VFCKAYMNYIFCKSIVAALTQAAACLTLN